MPRGIAGWRATASVLRSRVGGLRTPFASVVDDLVTTLFPADCRACGDPLLRADSVPFSVPVCNLCLSRLAPQYKAYPSALCRCCGEALGMESDRFAYPVEGVLCAPCRKVPPPFERAAAYGVYEGALREMLHLLKYDGVQTLAKPLGAKLAEAVILLEGSPAFTADLAVVAVPLFAGNQRRRGFNQSVLLADEAIARLRKLRPQWQLTARHGLLRRVRETESQFNLSTKGRRRNLVGAFKATDDSNTLAGRDVLLIDDIFTTGATSRACSLALRRAGARRVWVATLARAQKEQVALWTSNPDDFG
jgi:ComF family protein